MIKTGLLSIVLLSGGLLAKAQSTDNQNPMSDTTHRHGMHRDWNGKGGGNGAQGWSQNGHDRDGGDRGHGERYARRGGPGFQHHGFEGMVHYTPEQRKQAMAIETDYRHKQADLYKQDNLTLGAYKSQLVALDKEKKAKLKALITPEQQKQIDQRKARMSEDAQVMAAARLERMKIRLQLTDDQVARIKSQDESFRSQLKSIRDNDNLLPDQKRQQTMALFTKQKDAFTAVLTPDQQAKLKAERGHGGRFGSGFRQNGMRPGGHWGPDGHGGPGGPDGVGPGGAGHGMPSGSPDGPGASAEPSVN